MNVRKGDRCLNQRVTTVTEPLSLMISTVTEPSELRMAKKTQLEYEVQ